MGCYRDKAKEKATFKRYRERHKERLCSKTRQYLRTLAGRYSVLLFTARKQGVPTDLSADEHALPRGAVLLLWRPAEPHWYRIGQEDSF